MSATSVAKRFAVVKKGETLAEARAAGRGDWRLHGFAKAEAEKVRVRTKDTRRFAVRVICYAATVDCWGCEVRS